MKYKLNFKLMSFIHHYPLQLMNIFTPFFWLISALKLLKKSNRIKYKEKLKEFNKPVELLEFIKKIRKLLNYKFDGPKGYLHHYNTLLECLVSGADCEDYPRFAAKYLKKFYTIYVYFFGIVAEDNIKTWHYDCYFYYEGFYYLLNQGRFKEFKTIKELVDCLVSDNYMKGWYKDSVVWHCKW